MPESSRAQAWSLGFPLCSFHGRTDAVRLFNTADALKGSLLNIIHFEISEKTSGVSGGQLSYPRSPR